MEHETMRVFARLPGCAEPVRLYGMDGDDTGHWYAGTWFAFWIEDCYSPPIYAVRAETFEAAYETLTTYSDLIEKMAEPVDRADWGDYGVGPDPEADGAWDNASGLTFHENGKIYDLESLQGCVEPVSVWPSFVCDSSPRPFGLPGIGCTERVRSPEDRCEYHARVVSNA